MEKQPRPLIEVNPIVTEALELLIFGNTQEERDKEMQKKYILRNYQLGMEVEKIALFLDVGKELVIAIIAENENPKK